MSQVRRCDSCGTYSNLALGDDGWITDVSIFREDHAKRPKVYPATTRIVSGDFCSYKCFLAALPKLVVDALVEAR